MITNKDLNTLNLSPTNKDYYQVWSELIETAGKLSERWDPSSTNESDPGIVLLKVLTAIADKLNYNIDKNILEAFMPTAAQSESMRRLCEMLGYHIGYYESATTDVTIRYVGNVANNDEGNTERLPDGTDPEKGIGLVIPAFTILHNEDKSIYYSTTQEARLTNEETYITIPCIEGQRILCETGTSTIVTLANLDANNRYYLPEIQIAENGIFVYGTVDGVQTTLWKKVNNLNITPNDTKAYSFGFDSVENRPYLQFPDDIGLLIEDGLEIYYIRTSGAAGNISARTLSVLEKPTIGAWADYSDNEKFIVTNPKASYNGKNPESINQAYNGFKKTIGTFDTLVTCRDYMNKIYQLVDDQNIELVSNVIVSDIRDDINRAHVLCSFSDYGIVYIEQANKEKDSTVSRSDISEQPIDHFDLVVYPFKTYQKLDTDDDYKSSFTYSSTQMPLIQAQLADIKSIAHNYTNPVGNEITCIKNYLKLNARISTVNKVNSAEEELILANVKKALFSTFNLRELDFGEEIPYDSILACIEGADPKIKSVALDEPILYTKFATANGDEYDIASVGGNNLGTDLYNKLALRNVLAGRVELFSYDTSFKVELGEALYPTNTYSPIYPETESKILTKIVTECKKDLMPQITGNPITLKANEVVKFRAPSLKTLTPYSAYVNYHLILNQKNAEPAEAARFLSIDQLWSKSIDNRTEGKLPEWTWIDGTDTFKDDKRTFTLFGINFFRFLEQKKFYDKLTDFVEVGLVGQEMIKDPYTNEAISIQKAKDWAEFYDKKPEEGGGGDSAKRDLYLSLVADANTQLEKYTYAAKHCCLFGINGDNATLIFKKATESDFKESDIIDARYEKFYVVELQNTGTVLNALADWASLFGTKTNITDTEEDTENAGQEVMLRNLPYKLIDGSTYIFRNIGANYERNPGQYVDNSRQKFMPATQADVSQVSAWNAYYWPAPRGLVIAETEGSITTSNTDGYESGGLHVELTADGWKQVETSANEFEKGYTKTSVGTDAKLAGIKPLEEYQLKSGEHLFINYTPASTSATSDQATTAAVEPLNIHHGPGTIIKPNAALTLYDSNTYHSSGYHSWAKTTGFDFSAFEDGQDIEGMYSIGPNEQIDIRDFIEVTLSEPSYMYWMLNETQTLSAKAAGAKSSYTLQDGEYIFYTDKNKLDMAYYGAGTELRIEGQGIRKFVFRKDITQVNLEEIMLNGISAVPWKMISLDNNNYIVLREFQYITLTEGDSLRGLALQNKDYLDNDWTLIDANSPCYYAFAGEDMKNGGTPLPKFTFATTTNNSSTPNKGSDLGWEARSFLELNTSPDEAQVLNEGNSLELRAGNEILTVISPQKDETGTIIPMAIKTNVALTSPGGEVNLYANEAEEANSSLVVKLKVFEDAPIAAISAEVTDDDIYTVTEGSVKRSFIEKFSNEEVTEALNLYNFNTLWTLVSAEDFISKGVSEDDSNLYSWVRANANVPANHYNIMMLYYLAPETAYTYGQGMGFRFYTYRDKPIITMNSSSTMSELHYNDYTFKFGEGKTLETAAGYHLLETAETPIDNKYGSVLIDQERIIFKYEDPTTGMSFEDEYTYELDNTNDSLVISYPAADIESTKNDSGKLSLIASVELAKGATPEKLLSAICRGIKFIFPSEASAADNLDIIGTYCPKQPVQTKDESTIEQVTIFKDKICIYGKLKDAEESSLFQTWYYTYNPEIKTINLYKDTEKTQMVNSPLTEGCFDIDSTNTLTMCYKGTTCVLVYKVSEEANSQFFREYTASAFCEVLEYKANDGTMELTNYDVFSNKLNTEVCKYALTGENENTKCSVTVSNRFLLDEDCEHIRIFNNLPVEALDNFLDKSHDRALLYDDYFNQLSWWTQQDLGYTTSTALAFGIKEIPSYADLTKNNEDEEDKQSSASTVGAYRKISGVYFLKPGLNILTFKESGKFEFFPEIDAGGALFLSDIDSVKKDRADLGLNLDMIDYQYSDNESDEESRKVNKVAYKLLRDIRAKDPNNEFYYNCPLQSATALDINTSLLGSSDAEKLSDPKFWYEPNNMNNKFVISQIDADYLDKGIVIAKASKLK